MNTTYLLLGGNVGQREEKLQEGKVFIEKKIGKIVQQSSVYETAPWGFVHPQKFLNQVVCAKTELEPNALLDTIHSIEKLMGRVRSDENRWEERIIDIDILFFNDIVLNTEHLIIPHVLLHKRRFALVPLDEIAGEKIHPLYPKTMHQLLHECEDDNEVLLFDF